MRGGGGVYGHVPSPYHPVRRSLNTYTHNKRFSQTRPLCLEGKLHIRYNRKRSYSCRITWWWKSSIKLQKPRAMSTFRLASKPRIRYISIKCLSDGGTISRGIMFAFFSVSKLTSQLVFSTADREQPRVCVSSAKRKRTYPTPKAYVTEIMCTPQHTANQL